MEKIPKIKTCRVYCYSRQRFRIWIDIDYRKDIEEIYLLAVKKMKQLVKDCGNQFKYSYKITTFKILGKNYRYK